jgi:hypothetical protein
LVYFLLVCLFLSFSGVSLDATNMLPVVSALLISQPQIYSSSSPSVPVAMQAAFSAAVQKNWIAGPKASIISLTSVGGLQFSLFVKNPAWAQNLYPFVAQSLNQELLCETWTNGATK